MQVHSFALPIASSSFQAGFRVVDKEGNNHWNSMRPASVGGKQDWNATGRGALQIEGGSMFLNSSGEDLEWFPEGQAKVVGWIPLADTDCSIPFHCKGKGAFLCPSVQQTYSILHGCGYVGTPKE